MRCKPSCKQIPGPPPSQSRTGRRSRTGRKRPRSPPGRTGPAPTGNSPGEPGWIRASGPGRIPPASHTPQSASRWRKGRHSLRPRCRESVRKGGRPPRTSRARKAPGRGYIPVTVPTRPSRGGRPSRPGRVFLSSSSVLLYKNTNFSDYLCLSQSKNAWNP